MQYIVLDLEWNGAYCKKAHGYFNEIIEIGAVKVSQDMQITDRLDLYIRPSVSRKLTKLVTELTGITDQEVKDGCSFPDAVAQLQRFVGQEPSAVLTWSNTDLTVLMENCRYYFDSDVIPFVQAYADLQAYAQERLSLGTAQQVALGKFAELLGLDASNASLHHAIDDSLLTAQILQRVFDNEALAKHIHTADTAFYCRMAFKPYYITDIDSPFIRRSDLQFRCEGCGQNLKRCGEWKHVHRSFTAPFHCKRCNTAYTGRVQARRKYDSTEIKKRLLKKQPPEKPDETT